MNEPFSGCTGVIRETAQFIIFFMFIPGIFAYTGHVVIFSKFDVQKSEASDISEKTLCRIHDL